MKTTILFALKWLAIVSAFFVGLILFILAGKAVFRFPDDSFALDTFSFVSFLLALVGLGYVIWKDYKGKKKTPEA